MPKEIPNTINIDDFGTIGSEFEILECYRTKSYFCVLLVKSWSTNKKKQKKSPRSRPTPNETSRIEAKEGGGGKVNLPAGSEG